MRIAEITTTTPMNDRESVERDHVRDGVGRTVVDDDAPLLGEEEARTRSDPIMPISRAGW